MACTDSLPNDAPTISGTAETVRHGHIAEFDSIPVLEGSEKLRDLLGAPDYWDDKVFVFDYHLLPTVAVIAQGERAALAYLADSGFLDGLLVDRETARDDDRHYVRLGNADLPFDLQGAYMRLSTATPEDLDAIRFNDNDGLHDYRIIAQGVDMGVYKGETTRKALEKYARDAGYSGATELLEEFGRPKIKRLD
jgi:hypothetical protein